jgi:hypothetical protein
MSPSWHGSLNNDSLTDLVCNTTCGESLSEWFTVVQNNWGGYNIRALPQSYTVAVSGLAIMKPAAKTKTQINTAMVYGTNPLLYKTLSNFVFLFGMRRYILPQAIGKLHSNRVCLFYFNRGSPQIQPLDLLRQ